MKDNQIFNPKKITCDPAKGKDHHVEVEYYKSAEIFTSHLIERGKHFCIKGRLQDGKVFIDDETIEDTEAADDEYILFSTKTYDF